jgi:uncharacterized protein (DUF1015 family)
MAIISPFRGLTYNFHLRKDFSSLVAPPYDVISEGEQEAYYRADPFNVIRLILGKKKTGDSDWDNRYTRTAEYLKRWESEGILVRAKQPCLYITSLTYDPGNGGAKRTRWGVIALVRIEEQDSGVILPHEKTFSAHKDDRLKLMRACNAQFSQIFGIYEDPENSLLDTCRKAADFPPQIALDLKDGTKHRMWSLQSPPLFKKVADIILEKPIFIADGHHRYETARNYRNIMRARYGQRPANRSYEYVMMYLTNMADQGLIILPSHRLIKSVPSFGLESFLEKAEKWFELAEFSFSRMNLSQACADLKQRLEEAGRHNTVIAFYEHEANQKTEKFYLFSLKPKAWNNPVNDLHPALKKLDVMVLSRFVLQRCLGFSIEDLEGPLAVLLDYYPKT